MVATVAKRRIYFRYREPEAKTVFLAGSFNGWNPEANPMKKNKEGVWSIVLNLFPGVYEYRFVVDGLWKSDQACEQHYPNRYGGYNCVLKAD